MSTHDNAVSWSATTSNRRRGGDVRVMLSPRTVAATSGFMGALVLEPGESITEHLHPYSEEFLFVTAGVLTLKVDGKPVELATGDAFMVPIGVAHRAENNGTTPTRAVFHLSPLAPSPEVGHVDLEPLANPAAPDPRVAS